MPINVVKLEDLDTVIATTIQKVYDAVKTARDSGNFQVELPKSIDFQMTVVAVDGWQALEAKTSEAGETNGEGATKGTEKSTDKGTSIDHQESKEEQGGFTLDTREGTGDDTVTKKGKSTTLGANRHTQDNYSVQKNYEI